MGHYTELHFNAEIRKDAPKRVTDTLSILVRGDFGSYREEGKWMCHDDLRIDVDHPFFRLSRSTTMLTCDSCYFSSESYSTFKFDKYAKAWILCVRCNLKNYNDEIELFLDWVLPYVESEPGNMLGFFRYEYDPVPTLIYKTLEPENGVTCDNKVLCPFVVQDRTRPEPCGNA